MSSFEDKFRDLFFDKDSTEWLQKLMVILNNKPVKEVLRILELLGEVFEEKYREEVYGG